MKILGNDLRFLVLLTLAIMSGCMEAELGAVFKFDSETVDRQGHEF